MHYDIDQDTIPDVLDFDDIEQFDYTKDEVIQSRDISVPSRHYLKRLSYIDSPDTFVMNLTAGTEYTVEISKGDLYQSPIGGNVPSVSIFNPKGERLSFDVDEDSTILSPDVIEHSVYPSSEPYVICYTFTPAVSGRYKVSLGQSLSGESKHIYDDLTLFVYKELRNEADGEAGYYVRYTFYDEEGKPSSTLKMNDIVALRQAWNEASEDIISILTDSGSENSIAYTEVPSQVENFLECVRILKPYYGIFDDHIDDPEAEAQEDDEDLTASISAFNYRDYTQVPSDISGILYEDKYDLGAGFHAITGVQAQNVAVEGETINLPVPKTKAEAGVTTLFKAGFVSSQEDSEKFASTTVGGKIQLGGFGFSAGHSSSNSYKYGLTSTTYVIHYEETENKYRKLGNDAYEIRDMALDVLSEDGVVAFRDDFGDYFVAGYQYGGTYDAFIQITTKTTEQLDKIKTELGASYQPSSGDVISGKFARETSNLFKTNNATINIEIRTAGISDGGGYEMTQAKDLTDITTSLSAFRAKLQKTSPAEFHRVHVWLKRYNNIRAVYRLTRNRDPYRGYIPILSSHSTNILNFRKEVGKMHGFYNVIRDTDNTIMDQKLKNDFERRCDNIQHTITADSESLFDSKNAKRLENMYNDLLKLNDELISIGDRYAFYRLLKDTQEKEVELNKEGNIVNRPYGQDGGSIGYESFGTSKAINSDIEAGHNGRHDPNYKFYINKYVFGQHERTPSFTAPEGEVFCYVSVWAPNKKDERRDSTTIPAIGTRRMGFVFKRGSVSDMQWGVTARTMRFTQDRYPFNGLKQ